jgi:hypothetical protein
MPIHLHFSVPIDSGGWMMGGYYNSGGLGAMMSSSDWNWMDGAWQHMSRQDWRQLQQRLLGTGTINHHTGWSAVAIISASLAGAVLVLLAIASISRRGPFRRPPAATRSV